jgi:hypothetical protein
MNDLLNLSDAAVAQALFAARSRVVEVFDPAEVTTEGVKALVDLYAVLEEAFRRGVVEVKQGL